MIKHLNQYDLAARRRISLRTLERWRWEGIGPSHLRIGRYVRYRLEDVENYEQSRLVTFAPVQSLSENAG